MVILNVVLDEVMAFYLREYPKIEKQDEGRWGRQSMGNYRVVRILKFFHNIHSLDGIENMFPP